MFMIRVNHVTAILTKVISICPPYYI